jgi:putative DNA primase/helicase
VLATSTQEQDSDLSNAKLFVREHGRNIRFVHDRKQWFIWDQMRFGQDESGEIVRLAKSTVESLFTLANREPNEHRRRELRRHAIHSSSAQRIRSMLELAQSEREVSVLSKNLDSNPWLLNCVSGTVDLKTGVLRDQRREDLITKLVPCRWDLEARSPEWDRFLQRVMDGDQSLVGFLKRAVGYSLTGDTREQVLFLVWGTGANGKSTFINVIEHLMDGYAIRSTAETLLAKRNGAGIPNDIARLAGARFVSAVEAEDGRRLDEERIKALTGGDTVAARFLHQEYFEFRPQFKLWFGTNHKPRIRGTDEAIWRRLRLIPFAVTIPEKDRDPRLGEKLLRELPSILQWAVALSRMAGPRTRYTGRGQASHSSLPNRGGRPG